MINDFFLIKIFRFLKIKGLKPHVAEETSSKKPFFHLEKPLETKFVETKNQFSFIQNQGASPPKTNVFSAMTNENENLSKKNETSESLFKNPFEKNTNIFNIENIAENKNEKNPEKSPEKSNNVEKADENINPEKTQNEKTNENQAHSINSNKNVQEERLKEKETEPNFANEQAQIAKNQLPAPNEEKNPEESKPVASFGFKIDNPLSFSNPLQNKSKEEQTESQPTPFFNLSNPNFSNKPSTNLFGFPTPPTNIFGTTNTSLMQQPSQNNQNIFGNHSPSIFGNTSTTTFGNTSTGSLFGNQSNSIFNNLKQNDGKPAGMSINANNQKSFFKN